METRFVLTTIFEIALVAFVIFGIFNESKFAETERRVFGIIKRRLSALLHNGRLSDGQY